MKARRPCEDGGLDEPTGALSSWLMRGRHAAAQAKRRRPPCVYPGCASLAVADLKYCCTHADLMYRRMVRDGYLEPVV